MNETKPEPGGEKTRDPKKFRRTRNLPLILMLAGLMVIVLMNIDGSESKTALLTYAQFQWLGEKGAIKDIELLFAQDRVEIVGEVNKEKLAEVLRGPEIEKAVRDALTGREKYRVDSVMRGVVESEAVQNRFRQYVESMEPRDPNDASSEKVLVAQPQRLKMRESTHLLPTMLFTIAPWLLIGLFFWFFIFRPMRQAGGTGGVLSFGRSRAKLYTPEMANVTFADVAGVEERGSSPPPSSRR
jgi:ATP-dependent Zn protease